MKISGLKSHLQNRTQYVSVNGTISDSNTILSGVPQGSILGLLLFLLFINDLSDSIIKSTVDMYADDTLIYFCHNDVKTIETCLTDNLASLSKWLDENLMKVNVSRTKVMLLGTCARTSKINNINVVMNNCTVEKVNSFKYLGVKIDVNLKWNDHISNVCQKCAIVSEY